MRMKIATLVDGTSEVDIKLLDDGRACIHWLCEHPDGLIKLEGHPQLRAAMGREPTGTYILACRPKQNTINSQKRGGIRFICMTTDDLAQATCPDCLATEIAKALPKPTEDERVAQLQMNTLRSLDQPLPPIDVAKICTPTLGDSTCLQDL